MNGARREFVVARKNLIRILRALAIYDPRSVIVVGAQAVYLRTSQVVLPFAPFTYDSDLVLNPQLLATSPPIRTTLFENGYVHRDNQPGLYWASGDDARRNEQGTQVDLLVPEEFAQGTSRRDAGLPGDNERVARRTPGLEAALFDHDLIRIEDIADPGDGIDAHVAGPAALIIAKAQKIAERVQAERLLQAKDASDVFRVLRGHELDELKDRFRKLLDQTDCADAIRRGIHFTQQVFVSDSIGRELFADVTADEPERESLRESFRVLTLELGEMLSALSAGR
jgi:hypothetical protein